MSLLDEITQQAPVEDVDLRLEQRRLALIQQIKEVLDEKGWSQRQLAEEMDKEDSQVTRLLSPSSNPTLKTLVEIESALDRELFTVNRNIERKHSFSDTGEDVIILETNVGSQTRKPLGHESQWVSVFATPAKQMGSSVITGNQPNTGSYIGELTD